MNLFDKASIRFAAQPRLGFCLLLVVGVLLGVPPRPAAAAQTFTVNTTSDLVDYDPGDGYCSDRAIAPDSPKFCSLRAAIMEANALSGQDTIVLPANTYMMTQPKGLSISDGVVIHGAGMDVTIIDGGAVDRVIYVKAPGAVVDLANMTLRNGKTANSGGGVLLSAGELRVTKVAVVKNVAQNVGGIDVYNGKLTMVDSVVSGNTSTAQANQIGGIDIWKEASATINNTTIDNNVGTGLVNEGPVELTNSTISGNTEVSRGAGIRTIGVLKATNVTISGNTAVEKAALVASNSADVTLQHVTITNNHSKHFGVVDVYSPAKVTLSNSIIAGNTYEYGQADCTGTYVSAGYNVIGVSTSCTLIGTTTGNLVGINPRLGALQNNGGTTKTHALIGDSKAIDAANPVSKGKDQRNQARLVDGNDDGLARSDIGAFEYNGPVVNGITPATKPVGSAAFTLTVTGKKFTAKSQVQWKGKPRVTQFVNSTTLKAQITADDLKVAEKAGVRVVTLGATLDSGISNSKVFTVANPVPVITGLAPNARKAGSPGFTLVVNGTGFVSGAKVHWNGAERATTFVSATQVKATIPSSALLKAGTAQVTVANPAPGGGASSAKAFTITP